MKWITTLIFKKWFLIFLGLLAFWFILVSLSLYMGRYRSGVQCMSPASLQFSKCYSFNILFWERTFWLQDFGQDVSFEKGRQKLKIKKLFLCLLYISVLCERKITHWDNLTKIFQILRRTPCKVCEKLHNYKLFLTSFSSNQLSNGPNPCVVLLNIISKAF